MNFPFCKLTFEYTFFYSSGQIVFTIKGSTLMLRHANRHSSGAYLCIASNGVPPTVSKRIIVVVNCKFSVTQILFQFFAAYPLFPLQFLFEFLEMSEEAEQTKKKTKENSPKTLLYLVIVTTVQPAIIVRHEIVYASFGQKVVLECISESHPNSVNYWLHGKDFVQGKYRMFASEFKKCFHPLHRMLVAHFCIRFFHSHFDSSFKLYSLFFFFLLLGQNDFIFIFFLTNRRYIRIHDH